MKASMLARDNHTLVAVLLVCLFTITFSLRVRADDVPHYRNIQSVPPIAVKTTVGNAPQLPFQVWVKYSDGTGEYRNVRWANASPATEQAQANKNQTPVGTEYTVAGFVTGDNTTAAGFPLVAHVTVVREATPVPSPVPVAKTLPLGNVTLNGENRLTHNRDLDIDRLLSLDVRQQLYNYRDTYGLSTEGYPESDGWDSPTTKLKGHGSGHYMSAMAMAYASCTDKAKKARLLANIRTMVDELRRVQELTFVWNDSLGRYWEARDFAPEAELRTMKGSWEDFDQYKKHSEKYGYGYLNAIPAQHCALIEMYRAYNNEQWVWAPYYSVHKQLAGLIDIATYVDDHRIADKALLIARDMGLWVWNRLHYRTFVSTEGDQQQRRSRPGNRYEMWNMYIAGEVGGMAESLARLSELSEKPQDKERLLEAANYFDSPAFFDPLVHNVDAIRTRHANQHIPMITGALRSYLSNHNPDYYNIARNFWNMIQGRYRYAMGGVGNGEMFRQPYTQILSMNTNLGGWGRDQFPEPTINETCCAYNLAKLTRDLNCLTPDDASLMDYYERVLYNQLVGSVNPKHYAVLYQYAVGLNASKPWGNDTPQSTCCGGTGVENHVKYQEATYFVDDNTLWVALYLPTTAQWADKHVAIEQTCAWPAERSSIRVTKGSATFAMRLRVPYWATRGFEVRLNGQPVATSYQPSSYVEIPARKWTKNDIVEVVMPFAAHVDFGPDKMEIAATGRNQTKTRFPAEWVGALMYGPLVMATTGVNSWDEASSTLDPSFANVKLRGARDGQGADANIYTLTFAGHDFIPDYAADRHTTHYFRLHVPVDPNAPAVQLPADVLEAIANNGPDDTPLREAMQVARTRRDAQSAWNEMAVKVPEYAPWAKHGFARMMEQYDAAQRVLDNGERTQEDISRQAADLNAALNTMRPGNLPELEDMDSLLPLVERAKALKQPSSRVKEAVEYAEMVVKYVSDGSGTMDMIDRAVKQLKTALK